MTIRDRPTLPAPMLADLKIISLTLYCFCLLLNRKTT